MCGGLDLALPLSEASKCQEDDRRLNNPQPQVLDSQNTKHVSHGLYKWQQLYLCVYIYIYSLLYIYIHALISCPSEDRITLTKP